jgi:plasmid stabilization system protein ParE
MTYSVRITASATADMDELLSAMQSIREKYAFLSGISRKIADLVQYPELYQRPQNLALQRRGYRFFVAGDVAVLYRLPEDSNFPDEDGVASSRTVTIVRAVVLSNSGTL